MSLTNTISSTVLSANVVSDYVLTQETLYCQLGLYKTKAGSQRSTFRSLLGLNQGADRLFRYSAVMLGISTVSLTGLPHQAAQGTLASAEAQTYGFIGCVMLLISAAFYQTASKLSSFKLLNQ
ncbi:MULTISPECIES: hypothetical protein [Prochlorococcus]|uniref:hypothetical protein n=1 Tax=Prochlorococcus TaxID=1218 RepID=UPI001F3FC0BD|nr:hypothetical protein [Prochlorococcus marinus]